MEIHNHHHHTRFARRLSALVAFAAVIFYIQFPATASFDEEFFEKQVRPILVANCQKCHNPNARVAELDLTTAEGFARGGESGPLIDRAKPEESRLLKVISYDGNLKMPPKSKLKDEEIAVIVAWVKMGAPWPGAKVIKPSTQAEAHADAPAVRKAGREFTTAEKNFWAFQPVSAVKPPEVKNAGWVKSPIDRFILARLEAAALAPAPAADKLQLLRRVTFDLTGLPPTEDEIRAFLADQSPTAYAKVVDRLLASPRYGEQWGRRWLDVARYADSTGNDEDHRYPHAWRYRDYVIDAFNGDLPYDRFVREQIAGDLLPAEGDDAATDVNRRGIVATGFLALGAKALAQQDKMKMLYDVYDEQVDVASKAFLGLTVACARCHDHKFDPILTKDYYSLVSIFASTRSFKDPKSHVSVPLTKPLVPKAEYEKYQAGARAHNDLVKRNRFAIEEIIDAVKIPAAKQNGAQLAAIMLAARRVYAEKAMAAAEAKSLGLDVAAFQKWVDYLKPGKPREHLLAWEKAAPERRAEVAGEYQARFEKRLADWGVKIEEWRKKYEAARAANKSPLPDKPGFEAGQDRFFSEIYFDKKGPLAVSESDELRFRPEARKQLKALVAEREELKKKAPAEPQMACAVEEGEIIDQKVFIRGAYHNPGEDAPKDVPQILRARYSAPEVKAGSGRLEFANWVVRPDHPLTARVIVNRIWGWHFGEGIVRTPDNFGRMGEPPTHPELLDYLAHEFVRNGWSIKSLHRMILLSNAYQMSSQAPAERMAKDPDNRLFSHFPRRRLTVEEMRDAMLSVDGSLDLTMGGTLQSGTGTDGENDNKRLSLNPEKLNRRTVYLPLRRANLPALLNLFDFGDATTVSGKRQLTNVATQALFWLNSDFLADRATSFARALLGVKGLDETARLERAYLRILNRRPTAEEVAGAQKYLAGYRAKFTGTEATLKSWTSLCRVLMATNDFIYLD
jgi:hypothetical protein